MRSEFSAAATEFEASRIAAPERLAELQEELASAKPAPEPADFADVPIQELQARLISKEGELATARAELSSLEAEPQRRASRRTSIPQEIQALREKLVSYTSPLAIQPDATPLQSEKHEAEQALALSQRLMAETQIQALENERVSIDARSSVLTARRDAAVKQVGRLEAQVEQIRSHVEKLQKQKAEADAMEARKAAREVLPARSELAQENSDLADKRTGETSEVRFAYIAGLEYTKRDINLRMILPLRYPERAKRYGIRRGGGLLLCEPPGTGKTMPAKAIATELDATFYHVRPSDILSGQVGYAESNFARLFETLLQKKKAIQFIDEVEALITSRRQNRSTIMQRVISQILGKVDGLAQGNAEDALRLIGATNEPAMIDFALLRPGRFDT